MVKFTRLLVFFFTIGIFANLANAANFDNTATYRPGQLVIKLRPGFLASQLTSDDIAMRRLDVSQSFVNGSLYLVTFNEPFVGSSLKSKADELLNHASVEYVEPNYYYYLNATPNDPNFSDLYGLNNDGQTGGKKGADIGAVAAWQISTGSKKVLIGITDTGIDYKHPDLKDNIYFNPGETGPDANGLPKESNGIDDDQNGYVDDFRGWDFVNKDNDPMDDHGHGSHTAGTIGATGNNGIGITGVVWTASLVSMKIFSSAGSSTLDAIVEAIFYNSLLKVNISSNSWGGGPFAQSMFDAIKNNKDNNILFVAAAGNNSTNTDIKPNYPSTYDLDNIISVAATDHNDKLAYFSNYGIATVDVAAPGVNILSCKPGGSYQKMSGTSMAAPHVAGIAGLLLARYPSDDYATLKSRIISSADVLSSTTGKVATGRVNVFSALEEDRIPPSKPSDLEVIKAGPTSVTLKFEGSGDDGKTGDASSYLARKSPNPIESVSDWDTATQVKTTIVGTPSPAKEVILLVEGLQMKESGFLALKALDNAGLEGPMSESVFFETKAPYDNFEHLLTSDLNEALLSGGEASGAALYLCITYFDNQIISGKYGKHLGGCNIPYNGQEVTATNFKFVKDNGLYQWKIAAGKLPAKTVDFDIVNACRSGIGGGVHSGIYQKADHTCLISFARKTTVEKSFEVLTEM